MESTPPPPVAETSRDVAVTQAEQIMTALGERLLVERIHRVLDEGGLAAHNAFCETMLPYLQGLLMLLPRLVHEGAQPAAVEAVQILNSMVRESGASPHDAMAEGISFQDGLRQRITAQMPERDRPLVTALNQLSGTLLDVARAMLVTAQASSGPVPTPTPGQISRGDSETGLASNEYFEERFGEEILRAQRLEKELTLIMLDVGRPQATGETDDAGQGGAMLRRIATVLLAQTRGFDLATRLAEEKFALLLPETNRAGAAAILTRLARGPEGQYSVERPLPFRTGIAVYPHDGKTVHELIRHADNVLAQDAQPGS